MAHWHPRKLVETQLGVDFPYEIAQLGALMQKVVNFSDLRQDVERLSADAFSVRGASGRQRPFAFAMIALTSSGLGMSTPLAEGHNAGSKLLRPITSNARRITSSRFTSKCVNEFG